MRLAVLFSGGKDSCLAMYKAMGFHEVVCLVSIISESDESYMFHVPNIDLSSVQAKAVGLPLIRKTTKGEKEKELDDLKDALLIAKEQFGIDGVVTGAIKSTYQGSRIQKICKEIDLWCFNPLWLSNQIDVLKEIVDLGFKCVISGVFGYPLEKEFLGKLIDAKMIKELERLYDKYQLNPAGEGGEIETTCLDGPFFKESLKVVDYNVSYKNYSGVFNIKKVNLVEKNDTDN